MTAKLDAQLDDVMGLLFSESQRAVDVRQRRLCGCQPRPDLILTVCQEGRVLEAPADSDYDRAVVDLAEETKARATDRLKTPQEEAQAHRQRLEELEQKRIDR